MNDKKVKKYSHKKVYIGVILAVLFLCSSLFTLIKVSFHENEVGNSQNFDLIAASTPPDISDIQQTPPPSNVGYKDYINISCRIETSGPLTRAQINWTTLNWANFNLENLQNGSTRFWGLITPRILGQTVKYKIVADNAWGRNTSEEYSFLIIDNVPPAITHLNNSNWVKPLHPFLSTPSVLIECKAIEEIVSISWVRINISVPGKVFNATFNMVWNATASRYYFQYGIGINTTIIYYNIAAKDTNNNVNVTPKYSITIDRSPPAVSSSPVPALVQYNDSVYIVADITDVNLVSSVKFKWSLTWGTNYTLTMTNIGGTMWQTTTPLPAQNWHTTVYWEINATDDGNFRNIQRFSYRTEDYTPPNVTNIVFVPTTAPDTPVTVNVTMNEPIGASGINFHRLYYGLSSENYAYKLVNMVSLGGDLWSATIPEQEGDTVRWFIYAEDNAGNNYTSSVYEYTVGGGGEGIPFGSLLFTFLGLIFGIIAAYYLIIRFRIQFTRSFAKR